jgi:flagellar basal-body rod protein FlgB
MLFNISSSPIDQMLKVALDGASLRQQVIANNIANSNTENYQALQVTFEDELRQAMSTSGDLSASDIAQVTPHVEADPNSYGGVSIDQQMVQMSKNFIHYQALLKALNGRIELTNLALTGGSQ